MHGAKIKCNVYFKFKTLKFFCVYDLRMILRRNKQRIVFSERQEVNFKTLRAYQALEK